MTTREWTKILKTHPATSEIKIDSDFVKGLITITRHRIIENELRHYDFEPNLDIKPTIIIKRKSEIDITFDGKVKSSTKRWFFCDTYKPKTLNRFLRNHNPFRSEIKSRLKFIGGSSDFEIKKITYKK